MSPPPSPKPGDAGPANPELDKTLDSNWMPETADVADIWEALEQARANLKSGINNFSDRSVEKNLVFSGDDADQYTLDDIAFLQDAKKISCRR